MSEPTFQIRVADSWSKPYSRARLRQKFEDGHVAADTECSADNGLTTETLASILAKGTSSIRPDQTRVRRGPKIKALRRRERQPEKQRSDRTAESNQSTSIRDSNTEASTTTPAGAASKKPAVEDAPLIDATCDLVVGPTRSSQRDEHGDAGDSKEHRGSVETPPPETANSFSTEPDELGAGFSEGEPSLHDPFVTAPAEGSPHQPQEKIERIPSASQRTPRLKLPDPAWQSAPVTHTQVESPQPSAVALAAAAALKLEDEAVRAEALAKGGTIRDTPGEGEAEKGPNLADPAISTKELAPSSESVSPRPLRPGTLAIMAFGVLSVIWLVWWGQSLRQGDPFVLRSLEQSLDEANGDSTEALLARTEIMRMQINRLTRAVSDGEMKELDFSDAPILATTGATLPAVEYDARQVSAEERRQLDEVLKRIARMVQEKGADGRKLDSDSVRLYTDYVRQLIDAVDRYGPNRAAALKQLSEFSKLMYLIQLAELRSPDVTRQSIAQAALLDATNGGLKRLYLEYATGDAGLGDLFRQADDDERAWLALIRYWYYRAARPSAADRWLQQIRGMIEPARQSIIDASVAEVDAIE